MVDYAKGLGDSTACCINISMKTFIDFMEMVGPQTLRMSGYDVVVMQYSNKGPLFIIRMGEEEVARAWFDFSTEKWNVS